MALDPIMLEGREKLRQKMISEALEEKNPGMFRQLKKSGQLEKFVKGREREMYAAFREGRNKVLDDHQGKNYKEDLLEQAKAVDADLRSLWEETQATFLEFSPA